MCHMLAQANGRAWRPAGVLVTVDGTAYPGCPGPPIPGQSGFSSQIAYELMRASDGLWLSECVAYAAATYPMGPSIQEGVANALARINGGTDSFGTAYPGYPVGTPILGSGYSQGAIVWNTLYLREFLDPAGSCHNRFTNGDLKRIYLFGDPCRTPGLAYGTLAAGLPMPPKTDGEVTGGIAGPGDPEAKVIGCLTPEQTRMPSPYDQQPIVWSFVNKGDMYGDCPVGLDPYTSATEAKPGRVETGIFNIIMHATFMNLLSIARDFFTPISTVEAIFNAGKFFLAGMNAPHYTYWSSVPAAVSDALAIGKHLPSFPPA